MSAVPTHPLPTFRKPEEHPKGWGSELWLANTPRYCGKLLSFKKGAQFSAHFHDSKDETFYILSGRLKLIYHDLSNAALLEKVLEVGDVADSPRLGGHQIEALEQSVIVEVSSQHFELDSFRVRPGDSQKQLST
jgi:quercetin dioxygenase-like cupin family protein